MLQQIQILFLPFLACLVLTGIHVYLGIHVISRKVIFVDIALAQIAALGTTAAFLLGLEPRSRQAYAVSLGFAVLAAVIFSVTRTKHERVPQEAIIGLAYATAAATAILLADMTPHGAEHLHDLLAGSIVWVTPGQVIKTAILYGVIGGFHFLFRERFLLISLRPEQAYADGIRVRLWDFLFYLSFAVVITSSVEIAGVLLVFCFLVAPAVFAVMFFDGLKQRLITGWAMGTLVSAVGLFFSYDRPSGPTIIVGFALALLVGGVIKVMLHASRTSYVLAGAAGGLFLATGIGWGLYHLSPAQPVHAPQGAEEGSSLTDTPEHDALNTVDELRTALRDPHPNVRVLAITELAQTGSPQIVPDLAEALQDSSPGVREAAAVALARLGDASAVPALRQALGNQDEDDWVRLRMGQALCESGDREGLAVLLEISAGAEAALARLEALSLLMKLTGRESPPPQDADSKEFEDRFRELGEWSERHGDDLVWEPEAHVYRPRR